MTVATLKDSHRPLLLPVLLAYARNATYYALTATALLPSKLNFLLHLDCEGGVFFAFFIPEKEQGVQLVFRTQQVSPLSQQR